MATQFSTLDANGATFAIPAGMSFQTFWEDDGEGRQPNVVSHPWNSLDLWGADDLARWCVTSETVPDPLPVEVPMYRVKIVLAQQGLTAAVTAFMGSLPEPQKTIGQTLWDSAPSLVVLGDFALQVKAGIGLTDAQYAGLVQAAQAISL